MPHEHDGEFGARLRRFREVAGLTQEQLAGRAGLTANAISALERGERRRPYAHTVQALVAALELPAAAAEELASSVPRRGATPQPPESGIGHLPAAPTGLIGRGEDLANLVRLYAGGARLVTLTGPGGVGKTRLATELARGLADRYTDGAVFVALAPLVDAALVVPTIAQALGVREVGGAPLRDTVHAFLRDRQMLLVLDNLENLTDAAAEVAELVATAPDLDLLATSRAPLRLRGEREYPVRPLELPQLQRIPTLSEVAGNPAVELFVERAQAVDPGFALTRTNAAAIAAICRRLDGLPLAIELAAARIRMLDPTALLARLDQALPLLTDGARDLPSRQRTMERTIAWSYDRLDSSAQALFRRLAVFAGGFTLEAAEAVGADPNTANDVALGPFRLLLEQSLVATEPGEVVRFRLLEPVRQYAHHQLVASGELAHAKRAHAAWYLRLAEAAEETLGGVGADRMWLDRLETEHDNLRGALGWLLRAGDAGTALRISAALWPFWHYHSHLSEGRRWLREGLAAAPQAPASVRARALLGAAFLAHYQGDDDQANDLVNEALELTRDLDDTHEVVPQRRVHLLALLARGVIAEDQGSYDIAEASLQEAHHLACASGDRTWTAVTLFHLGVVAYGQRHVEVAVARLEAALSGFRALPDPWGTASALDYLGLVATERPDQRRAAALYAESLALFREIGARDGVAGGLANVAVLTAATGQSEAAARLFGAAEALAEEVGALPKLPERAAHERGMAAARRALAPSDFAAAHAAGRAQPVEQVIDEAVALVTGFAAAPTKTPSTAPGYPAGLTEREVEVLRLVAGGLGNAEVAERLFLSRRTVDAHLQRVYGKLDVPNRGAAIRFAVEHGLA